MATPRTLQLLLLVAGLLLGCGERSGTATTDAGHATTSTGTTSTEAGTTTASTALPITTGGVATTADTGPAGGCLGDADCAPDQCVGPSDEVCPQCLPTMLMCANDLECAPGDVCIEVPESCPCDTPFTTICAPVCNTSADCAAGGVCDPGSNHCLHDPCASDEDCPPLFDCVPVLGGDACRPRRCDSDGDCGGAVCIDGLCHATPGTCIAEL